MSLVRPLARSLVRALPRPLIEGGGGAVSAPAAFTVGMWTLSATGVSGELEADVLTLPALNGGALTDIQYRLDGGSALSTGATTIGAFYPIGLTDDVEVDFEIRAVNSAGAGPWSDVKSATPTAAATDRWALEDDSGIWELEDDSGAWQLEAA